MLPDLDSASSTNKSSIVVQQNYSELPENTRLFHVFSCPVFSDENSPFHFLGTK